MKTHAAVLKACRFLMPLLAVVLLPLMAQGGALPEGFVYLDEAVPGIMIDARYYGDDNFLGTQVDGYLEPRVILTRQAAEALAAVQEELTVFGLGLKVFDGYRPQRAVDHFVRWAKDLEDTKAKARYYPDVPKSELFKRGYIASRSSHTRGSTVDLTIVGLDGGEELDMGSGFDFFSPVSWPTSMAVGAQQRSHRMLLHTLMLEHGFNYYDKEWWHFTLAEEPFPDTYFDFPVE